MAYRPPVREQLFVLFDLLGIGNLSNLEGFSELTPDLARQILEEGARICADKLAPLNAIGDKTGCKRGDDGSVSTPPGFAAAWRDFVAGGWPALSAAPRWGGQGLPAVLALAFSEMSSSANMAFSMYPGLTHGAYSAIVAGGSEAQQALYLPRLASGEWCGTMNLTEPQCGTDLGLLRTKARPAADGAYEISGEKIWISAGEHDLADNIVHLVLARIEGAPEGVRGISLFVVPKFLPGPDGRPGARNRLVCAGLEEKMGIHANATCFMSYDGARGWLVGEENRGLSLMFVMMNEARIGVGLQGLAQAEAAMQAAADFARERLQGRSLTGPKNAQGPADPIIVHPDVRRMLMDARAILEGGRAFVYWTALKGDLARRHPDPAARQAAEDLLGLMTPVAKAFLTDRGFAICSDAVQICGGAGYTEHLPVSQYLRDCRITLIYEGTNGVQALDLVGRKLAANGGRAVMGFFSEIDAFAEAAEAGESQTELAPFVAALLRAKGELQEASLWLMQNGPADPDNVGAASVDYLHLMGLTALAYMWAQMARAALAKIAVGETDPYFQAKLVTGRHFIDKLLPETSLRLARIKAGAASLMALPAEAF
ncbi:MAG TPA: acyl-CoA dehydrogenase C-terminal domain-containing protein [Caulobacteraceae bacterium]|nr:acyl-CoA dehydrogenase C-terminal domain-containing protein [Caulobacteraceae bacterium]